MKQVEDLLSELKSLYVKTESKITQNKILLRKLTSAALNQNVNGLNEDDVKRIYLAIGTSTVHIIQMKSLLCLQKKSISKIKLNEFLITPLILVKRLLRRLCLQ